NFMQPLNKYIALACLAGFVFNQNVANGVVRLSVSVDKEAQLLAIAYTKSYQHMTLDLHDGSNSTEKETVSWTLAKPGTRSYDQCFNADTNHEYIWNQENWGVNGRGTINSGGSGTCG